MDKSVIGPLLVVLVCILLTQGIAFLVRERNSFIQNYLAIFTIGLQWIFFLHAGGIIFGNERTEKYYDLMGTLTFVTTLIIAMISSNNLTIRLWIMAALVTCWTLRLGAFLFTRIHNNNGVDSRFTEIKVNNYRFLMTWTLQGVWAYVTLLPFLILSQKKNDVKLGVFDYVGISLWIIGFICEALADYQKSSFRSVAENKDQFINTGLWAFSRHPNYFGEILLWIGFSLIAFGGSKSYYVFISPVFIALLLIFVSGIPLLEKKADERYGDREDYQKYKKSTPVLVPFIGRAGSAMF